jgi:MFS family permease
MSDRMDRVSMLIAAIAFLIASDLVLAFSPNLAGVWTGVAPWGLHMGFTHGLFAALIADIAPPELRGTAFGMFNLVTGLAMLGASIVAGALWDIVGPQTMFIAGALFVASAGTGLLPLRQSLVHRKPD